MTLDARACDNANPRAHAQMMRHVRPFYYDVFLVCRLTAFDVAKHNKS
jgi:hypothetical protein